MTLHQHGGASSRSASLRCIDCFEPRAPILHVRDGHGFEVAVDPLSASYACFVKGTLVHTREGLRPIDELEVGDHALSSPEDGSGTPEYRRVVATASHEHKTVRRILASNPTANEGEMIAATGNHPFWVESIGWTRADSLARGNILRRAAGSTWEVARQYPVYGTHDPGVGWTQAAADVVTSNGSRYDYLEAQPIPSSGGFEDILPRDILRGRDRYLRLTVYDIEVEDFHTFYVGKAGIWVHDLVQS
jgi:hypothetical protein